MYKKDNRQSRGNSQRQSSSGTKRHATSRPSFKSGRSGGTFGNSNYKGGSSSRPQRPHQKGSSRLSRPSGGRQGRKIPTFNPSQFINQNPVEVTQEVCVPKHKNFEAFGLNKSLNIALERMGLKVPSPIQDQIIPEIMASKDVVGLAETGTGKTAAFLLPLIERTLKGHNQQTLILAPTRELAIQIESEFKKIAAGMHLNSVVCVGGANINQQIKYLRRKNHFIIGTPGRIIDLMTRKNLVPADIKNVVLDEADRMLDMGFINDIKLILAALPQQRSTLFFSATMPADAKRLVNDFLRSPVTISVKKKDVTNSIEQDVVMFEHSSKFETLMKLFSDPSLSRVLIFGSMKHSVQKLARELGSHGIPTEAIHGNKSHGQRQRALAAFKNGTVRVLVATDVAARGIHVDDVSHVINYDLPQTFEDYVHRIGRTGRADKRGKALTFVQK
ncbi:MAG: DEAD/DEAH box helicase [bacterium]|nr:DEAD/DEAH box helicase [bacterium]